MTIMKQCLTKNSSKSRQGSESRRKRPGKMIAPGIRNQSRLRVIGSNDKNKRRFIPNYM